MWALPGFNNVDGGMHVQFVDVGIDREGTWAVLLCGVDGGFNSGCCCYAWARAPQELAASQRYSMSTRRALVVTAQWISALHDSVSYCIPMVALSSPGPCFI